MSFTAIIMQANTMFVLQIFMLLLYCVGSQKLPCPKVLTINITDGERKDDSIVKDGITFVKDNYFVDGNSNDVYGCICNIKPCVRKCCGPNEVMVGRDCTEKDVNISLPVHNGVEPTNRTIHNHHYYVHNMECEYGKMLLMPHLEATDDFYVQMNGSLFLPEFDVKTMRDPEEYCIETFTVKQINMEEMISILLCNLKSDIIGEEPPTLYVTGMIISMPFLLATFIAYALLPDRNLHMKALMFYVITLMLSYLLLVIVQLTSTPFSTVTCTLIGYFCLFFFLVSFFWMNVICIDIWFAFSGLRGFSGSKSTAERKRFLIYCGYAWGMPTLHIMIVYAIDRLSKENTWYRPGIGNGQCFLKIGYPELFYFYGPMALLITVNIVLFAVTAIKIRSVKKDTSMLKKEDSKRHSYENDKQIFNLYLKLLFAMGVNWSMEIISWAVIWAGKGHEAIWYLTDFCNAIYGVFIFFIFVFKRNIWKLLQKRYYSFIGRPHLAHSMTTSTNATRTTSYSTTVPMSENPHGGSHDTRILASEA